MKAKHLYEEQYYLLSNTSVHNDEIFANDSIRLFMLQKMKHYLGEILEISHYLFLPREFQILVRTKSREDYISFYQEKYNDQVIDEFFIPKSSYIISQQMANLQVSLAKFVNKKMNRKGALVAGRYKKLHLESAKEYEEVISEMNRREMEYIKLSNREKSADLVLSSRKYYNDVNLSFEALKDSFKRINIKDLRGQLEIVSPNNFTTPYFNKYINNFRKKYPLIKFLN